MRKLLTILSVLAFTSAFASTTIDKQIRYNTTWTKAGSPYILKGEIEIAPGATLTIGPGVEVRSEKRTIVYGYVHAVGTATDPIRFDNTEFFFRNINDSAQMIFEHCTFKKSEYIGDRVFSFSHETLNITVKNSQFINCGISGSVQEGNHLVRNKYNFIFEDCIFNDGYLYIRNLETFILKNSEVRDGTVIIENCKYGTVTNNKMNGGKGYRLMIDTLDFYDNIVVNTIGGIAVDIVKSTIPLDRTFSNNIIANNSGIGLNNHDASGLFVNNSIYNNGTGIRHSFYPQDRQTVYKNNCVYDNKNYNFHNVSGADYHIDENWWGTTDSTKMEDMIYDDVDDFKVGKVSFMPMLQQSHNSCSTYSPPSTDVPEINKNGAQLTAYPNPFDDVLNIEVAGNASIQKISLYNLVGKLVKEQTYNNTAMASLETVNLAQGIYIYKVTLSNDTTITGKVTQK